MSSAMMKSSKFMKRAESRKSHSWWWDSHISPKNSKWLSENLEEMDQSVKRMLKLIEEDADSFAKKAEMYYQKRPQLVSHVEEFYRMYRSLAERYDQLTGELRKTVPNSDLESQGSGISEESSESRRRSGPRGSDIKDGDKSSESESGSDSDDSSGLNEQELLHKVTELENELREAKEKLLERSEILPNNVGESMREITMYKSLSDRDEEIRGLKEAISNANRTLSDENTRIQGEMTKLSKEKMLLEDNLKELELNREWMEEKLKASSKERDELGSKIVEIVAELDSTNGQIAHMEWHLKEMHVEKTELVKGTERYCRRIEELEEEIEKQRVSISEGAEGKREAIRQLCFSIEHYRNDYRQLLQLAFPGQKRLQSQV